ncbi:putative leucine-rich repeat-containing protein DDB_G0290503 [Physella acuta]|uniref:putative leucine-rich repeat-containing protein DDB_G0290503 n=1 Tax=Physella acuta TaxID=109671 RepID=UPI0027DEA4DB|nr:putative leucine-rich repeat-containing protein DDB_G0290503 [Physella acuta]
MSDHLKKYLTTQLELLDESSFHLWSNISDFVQQIKTRANECVDNIPDSNKAVKDAIAMVTTAQSRIIEHTDMFTDEYNPETSRRLKDFETVLSSLQDTKQKTEDDISEIKQWRDNFVTEHSDLGIKVHNFTKKQKQNFKNLRKQLIEQDNKIEELTKQIESLKTKESDTDKTLEKLSLDMKEYENNLHTLNKEMRVYTNKTDHVTQEIKNHSDLISAIKVDKNKKFETLLSKHVVLCKLLQQRLMPIDKMIETYNQNSETTEGKIKKIEKEVLKLSNDVLSIANQRIKHSTLGFVASQGRWDGTNRELYTVITFNSVERNVGNHFNPNTGEFTAPVDGLYKAKLTIKQTGDKIVGAGIKHMSDGVESWLGSVGTKDKYVEASKTFAVRLKFGDILYSYTGYEDCECTHFSCSLLTV